MILKVSEGHNGKVTYIFHRVLITAVGIMILVRDDLDFKLNLVSSDNNRRYIIMETEVQGSSLCL